MKTQNILVLVLMLNFFFLSNIKLGAQNLENYSTAVELTRRNVLYLGVDNPVKVAVSGCEIQDVKVEAENAKVYGDKGYLIVHPENTNKVILTISCKELIIRKTEFRVEKSPDPIAQVGGINRENVSKSELLAQTQLKAIMRDFDYDLRFIVEKFTMVINTDGIQKEFHSNSSKFTKEQKNEIHQLKPGKSISFQNIQARGSDGTTRMLKEISLIVR